ncbi:MAG: hypothetical protein U9O18_05835 [Chloroflexota bacterium]|nr:hypothetical protein [Chloroflexota bacterium]
MTGTRETAAQLDSAIDTLLRGPSGPSVVGESGLIVTARLLRDTLPRLHPRFTFEELLASRLAVARRLQAAPSALEPMEPTRMEPTPIGRSLKAAPAAAAVEADSSDAAERRRRGLVAGGAIASGVSLALPIAGAALVVWRRSRSSGGIL